MILSNVMPHLLNFIRNLPPFNFLSLILFTLIMKILYHIFYCYLYKMLYLFWAEIWWRDYRFIKDNNWLLTHNTKYRFPVYLLLYLDNIFLSIYLPKNPHTNTNINRIRIMLLILIIETKNFIHFNRVMLGFGSLDAYIKLKWFG